MFFFFFFLILFITLHNSVSLGILGNTGKYLWLSDCTCPGRLRTKSLSRIRASCRSVRRVYFRSQRIPSAMQLIRRLFVFARCSAARASSNFTVVRTGWGGREPVEKDTRSGGGGRGGSRIHVSLKALYSAV